MSDVQIRYQPHCQTPQIRACVQEEGVGEGFPYEALCTQARAGEAEARKHRDTAHANTGAWHTRRHRLAWSVTASLVLHWLPSPPPQASAAPPAVWQTLEKLSQFRIVMSDQTARAHTSKSNRAKVRDSADRKAIFKSVVDNPFRIQWPAVPLNAQNAILACVVDMLSGVAEHNLSRERASRAKRKRSHAAPTIDPSKIAAEPEPRSTIGIASNTPYEDETSNGAAAGTATPPIFRSLAVGINETTKHLETVIRSHRRMVNPDIDQKDVDTVQGSSAPRSRDRLVVVCRADVDPPVLLSHIPNLVATCNSRRDASGRTWLVSLPKGAEHTLAEAMGLRRAAVMLVEDPELYIPALGAMLQNVPLLVAPWLESRPFVPSMALVPTHIKQLRTTAPKDMRSAKEQRARGRAAAKERRKTRMPPVPKRVTLTSEGINDLPAAS